MPQCCGRHVSWVSLVRGLHLLLQEAFRSHMLEPHDMAVNLHHNVSKVSVFFRQSKSNPFETGVTIYIRQTWSNICPVTAILDYLMQRGMDPGPLKTCPHWIQIQTGSVTKLPSANSMRIQCASIASTLHYAEPNSHMHIDFKWPHLHTATMAPLSDLYFSQPSLLLELSRYVEHSV